MAKRKRKSGGLTTIKDGDRFVDLVYQGVERSVIDFSPFTAPLGDHKYHPDTRLTLQKGISVGLYTIAPQKNRDSAANGVKAICRIRVYAAAFVSTDSRCLSHSGFIRNEKVKNKKTCFANCGRPIPYLHVNALHWVSRSEGTREGYEALA